MVLPDADWTPDPRFAVPPGRAEARPTNLAYMRYGHGSSFPTMVPIGFNVTGRRITEFLLDRLLAESVSFDPSTL